MADNQSRIFPTDGTQTEFDLTFLNVPLIAEPGEATIRVDKRLGDRTLTADTHDGGDGQAALSVSGASFTGDNVVIGDIVLNTTDGSWGEITALTATTITSVLQGGSNNVWDDGDVAVVPTWTAQDVSNDVIQNDANDLTIDVLHDAIARKLYFMTAPASSTWGFRIRFTNNFVGGQVSTDDESYEKIW